MTHRANTTSFTAFKPAPTLPRSGPVNGVAPAQPLPRASEYAGDAARELTSMVAPTQSTIERTIGVIMCASGCDADAALRTLRAAAAEHGLGLAEVATTILTIAAGRLPPTAIGPATPTRG